jgi:phosphate starvation-inducible PhoH-like protein
LAEAIDVLAGVEGVAITRFTDQDVVRHPLVGRIIRAYEAKT